MIISTNFTPINFPITLTHSIQHNEHVLLSTYFYNIVKEQLFYPFNNIPEYYIIFYALPNNKKEFTLYCIRYNTQTHVIEYMIDCRRTYVSLEQLRIMSTLRTKRFKTTLCGCHNCFNRLITSGDTTI
jgi:hypothetical protein